MAKVKVVLRSAQLLPYGENMQMSVWDLLPHFEQLPGFAGMEGVRQNRPEVMFAEDEGITQATLLLEKSGLASEIVVRRVAISLEAMEHRAEIVRAAMTSYRPYFSSLVIDKRANTVRLKVIAATPQEIFRELRSKLSEFADIERETGVWLAQ